MSKRKHRQAHSQAGSAAPKAAAPSPAAVAGSGGALKWIIAAVVLVGIAVCFLKPGPAPEPDNVGGQPAASKMASNAEIAVTSPAPAPSVPVVSVPASSGTNGTNTAKATTIDTNSVSDMLSVGNYMLKQNRFEDAERAYRRAIQINPDDEDSHFNLAVALVREQRYEDAAKEYENALKIYPDYVEAKNNLANVLFKLGRTNDAIAQLQEAVQLNPDYVQALNNLGRFRAVEGKLDAADKLLRHAAELDPKDFEVQFNLGNLSIQKHDPVAAVTYFEAAHNLKPEDLMTVNLLAKALTLSGKGDKALETLHKYLGEHPDSPGLLYNTGLLEMGSGHPAEAVTLLQKVIKLVPTYEPAKKALKEAEAAAAKATTPNTNATPGPAK